MIKERYFLAGWIACILASAFKLDNMFLAIVASMAIYIAGLSIVTYFDKE